MSRGKSRAIARRIRRIAHRTINIDGMAMKPEEVADRRLANFDDSIIALPSPATGDII